MADERYAGCVRAALHGVREVEMWGCIGVTTAGVRNLATKLGSKLRTVNLRFCGQLGDAAALVIAEHCPLLERLYPPPNVGDAALTKLRERWAHLTKLL
jgi:hypothetical protein